MRAVEGQAGLRGYPEFVEQRKTLELVVSRTATQYADQVLTEAGKTLDRGDYDGGLAQLKALMPLFDLPDFPMGEAPAGVTELYEKGRIARERMHTIEQTRDVFERRRDRQDAVAVAVALGFGGTAGLEKELRQFDFAAAKKRVDEAASKVSGGPARALLVELAADCERARSAVETLGRECASGGWRRKSFTDPRERKNLTRNATGADATGLLYDGDAGADHVPWSAFGGNTKEISKLFFERLARDWTAAELRGIAALLRLEACVEVVDLTAKMFDGQKKSNFTENNQRDVLEVANTLTAWSARAPEEKDEMAREMEAAGILAMALRQATETQWSASVSQIERLLYDYQDTLLVRLLSNGKPAEEPR
jgi:hypothetical protein